MPSKVPTVDDLETVALDGDMTASDFVYVLRRLPFPSETTNGRPNRSARCVIRLDRDARDYLVSTISALGK